VVYLLQILGFIDAYGHNFGQPFQLLRTLCQLAELVSAARSEVPHVKNQDVILAIRRSQRVCLPVLVLERKRRG
jgi:hypothetical protein